MHSAQRVEQASVVGLGEQPLYAQLVEGLVHRVQVGPGSLVESCAVTINFGPGITAVDALVRGNSARGNSGTDIDATSSTVLENH